MIIIVIISIVVIIIVIISIIIPADPPILPLGKWGSTRSGRKEELSRMPRSSFRRQTAHSPVSSAILRLLVPPLALYSLDLRMCDR